MNRHTYLQKYFSPYKGEAFNNFEDLYFGSKLKYFASNLLENGWSHTEIENAVNRAIQVAHNAGLTIRKHFLPLYTQQPLGIVKDCKLSKLGYALLLLNGNPNNPDVAKWQLKLISKILNTDQ